MKINSQNPALIDSQQKVSSRGKEDVSSTRKTSSETAKVSGVSPEISAKAKEFALAKEVAMNAEDVREAKLAELRRRIENNEYNVKPEAIADRLVDEHLQTLDLGL